MSPTPMKKLLLVSLLSIFVVGGTSNLAASTNSQYTEGTLHKRGFDILKTTTTEHHIIDWISIHSQGKIAQPPPARAPYVPDPTKNVTLATSELQQPGAELGPPGTVPILRANLTESNSKLGLPTRKSSKEKSKRQYYGDRWFCSSDMTVDNYGTSGAFTNYKPFMESNADFSSLQTAVAVESTSKGEQYIEVGWINYPDQELAPHIFTYYTTGYPGYGNNIGGWNQEVEGWVQYSSTIFPGTTFTPATCGTVHIIPMEYEYWQGNWWLAVLNEWIGYYPGSLFTISGETTLADYSDTAYFYGEVYQTENALTTTAMGSGEFPLSPCSAIISNMGYLNSQSTVTPWTNSFWCTNTSMYDAVFFPSSGPGSGSYVEIGGPGAGVVNG